jgi:O-antigen/teichoic acid export membrane protein
MSLTHTAISALKWSALVEIATRAVGPLTFLVLARILVPDDFGLVAVATLVVSFSQVFWDAGLSKALIQRDESIAEAANVVFWINLGLGLVIFLILLSSAEIIASFFHDHRAANVIRVLSIQLPLAASTSVHTALLQKNFQFQRLFWIQLITTSGPALASIPLAIAGMGYWALVAGTLTGQSLQTLTLWRISKWRPAFRFRRALAKELWSFGRWVMLNATVAWFYGWMDSIIVGHYLGTTDMGMYRVGNSLVMMVFGLFFRPLLPVLYSVFCRAQHDLSKIREGLLFVAQGIALVSMPIAFSFLAMRHPIEKFLFGPNWEGIDLVIGIMALSHGFAWIIGANGEAYRAIGRPYLETVTTLGMLPIYFIGYLLAVHHGFTAFVFTRCAMSLLSLPVHIVISSRFLGITIWRWVYLVLRSLRGAAVCYSVIAIGLWLCGISVLSSLAMLGFGAIVYAFVTVLMERSFVAKVFQTVGGMPSS